MIPKTYLGDGVYVEVEDGMLKLTTERETGIHTIYLEPEVMERLVIYYRSAVRAARTVSEQG